jgi:hypothetical protein
MSSVTLQLGNAQARLDHLKNRVFAGRDPTACGLAHLDPGLSRRHAEVWLDAGQTYIRDLGSSNGTWVDGQLVGAYPVQLRPGQRVYLGTTPLGVTWEAALGGGATMVVAMPDELRQLVELRKQGALAGTPPPASMPMAPAVLPGMGRAPVAGPPMPAQMAGAGHLGMAVAANATNALGVGGAIAPIPAKLANRRQGANDNGVLLIALDGDTFTNGKTIEGFVEFTATDNETVACISVELVEFHKRGPSEGHVWDRVLVRQGPWKTKKGDVLPLPFALRVPPGTSISGREVIWEIRGQVDINWAVDIDCIVPINVRNTDVERIRDALGGLDYRIAELESEPLGQQFIGTFQPPANLRSQWGIHDIAIKVDYLGANLQIHMHIDKKGIFKRDRDVKQIYDLERLRAAPVSELSAFIKKQIDEVMQP